LKETVVTSANLTVKKSSGMCGNFLQDTAFYYSISTSHDW